MRRILIKSMLTVLVLCGFAYAFRNVIATSWVGAAIERREGMHCTKPQVAIASGLDRMSIGKIECTMNEGPVRYAGTEGDTVIELSGFQPQRVWLEKLTLDQRERDVSHIDSNMLGDAMHVAGFSDTLVKGMLDASELYSTDPLPVTVDELVMKREGKREVVLHDFRKALDGVWDRSWASRVETPGLSSSLVAVQALDMRVTPSHGRLNASVYFATPKHGQPPDLALHVEAKQLDKTKPLFSVGL